MKNIYLLVIVLVSGFSFGQSYMPIPESDAVWIQGSFFYSAYNGHEHATITRPLSFGNDSIVGGETYHTLHGHGYADWIDGWGNRQTYQDGTDFLQDEVQVLFRQDVPNKQVFAWDNSNNQEGLLYDFDAMVVGQPYPQTITNLDYPQILVMAYDSVMLTDGLYHERWILGTNSNDSGFVSIIEGVGSTMGFNLPIGIPFEQSSATLCMTVDGNPVYDGWANANGLIAPRYSKECAANLSLENIDTQLFHVFPVPTEDRLTIRSSREMSEIRVVDLFGRLQLKVELISALEVHVSLGDLRPGNYMLQIQTTDGRQFVKQVMR